MAPPPDPRSCGIGPPLTEKVNSIRGLSCDPSPKKSPADVEDAPEGGNKFRDWYKLRSVSADAGTYRKAGRNGGF